jgi:hypothetical protein
LPDWFALIVHVPTATGVTVVPLTVQNPVVVLVNVTESPDDELALSAIGAPNGFAVMAPNVIVWFARATVNERDNEVALYAALPAWTALIVQVPAATKVAVVPLTVQMDGVFDVKLTVRPELEVAVSASVPGNMDCVAIAANVMVWLVLLTEIT